MTTGLILMMLAAVLGAVVLYTFIGFIPGTDETSVLAPVTLAVVLAGAPPQVVLAFFVSAVVTLNLMNGIPTALVGLPGGVMSAPLMDHSVFLRNKGLASETIRKMAVGSTIGTLISIPLSFALAGLLGPIADPIMEKSPIILAVVAVLLAQIRQSTSPSSWGSPWAPCSSRCWSCSTPSAVRLFRTGTAPGTNSCAQGSSRKD